MRDLGVATRTERQSTSNLGVGGVRVRVRELPTLPQRAGAGQARGGSRALCVCIALSGAQVVAFATNVAACARSTTISVSRLGSPGSSLAEADTVILVLEIDTRAAQACALLPWVQGELRLFDRRIDLLVHRLGAELRATDPLARLAAETAALDLLVAVARRARGRVRKHAPPPWLSRVEDLLRDRFAGAIRVTSIAAEVGVHPTHLSRVFRARHGTSVVEYLRRVRVEWAAARMLSTAEPLAEIAVAAGFADQSHFTRSFRRTYGVTPDRYRRAAAASDPTFEIGAVRPPPSRGELVVSPRGGPATANSPVLRR